MFYKMLFDRFVGFGYLYTVLDMPRQIRIVCLYKDAVLCFVNNGLADKTSTEPGLGARYQCEATGNLRGWNVRGATDNWRSRCRYSM